MSTIKHQCPSCGGSLIVDNDKQLYRCPSCGSTYDFDYFREEKLHDMGETHLSRKEYAAAVDAYNLILENDPHDFHALRGLMLASAYLNDMDGLIRVGEAKYFRYDPKIVSRVIKSASEEDKEYFKAFGKIYSDKKKLIDRNRELEELVRDRDRTEAASRFDEDERYDYYFTGKNGSLIHPLQMFINAWVGALFAIFLAFCFMLVFGMEDISGSLLLIAIVAVLSIAFACVFNFTKVLPQMRELREVENEIRELKAEAKVLGDKAMVLEAEVRDLADELRKSIKDFVEKDSLIVKDSAKKPVSEFSKIKKHQCPSCGGSLRIDSDKQMYHCTFCGSTYDYEYFREERLHEAGEKYLARGEFKATADAYEFMIKKDPHDFLALRGLMLAAARLTSMSELDLEDEEGEFSYDSQKVRQAIESAQDEDKEYFKEFANVYSEKKRLADKNADLKALRDEKDRITSVIAHNNVSRKDSYLGDNSGPKVSIIIISIICGIWFFVALFFVMGLIGAITANASGAAFETFLVLTVIHVSIFLGLLIYTLVSLVPKAVKLKRLDKSNTPLYVEAGKVDEKINALDSEIQKLSAQSRRTIHNFVKKDRAIMNELTGQM